jgi:hypothetical protein
MPNCTKFETINKNYYQISNAIKIILYTFFKILIKYFKSFIPNIFKLQAWGLVNEHYLICHQAHLDIN